MDVRPLAIDGAWLFTPAIHSDSRGEFAEVFTSESIAGVAYSDYAVAQMNLSHSRAGTVRGVHFADVPPGQSKYVQCVAGRILDVVVDIRVGSPTFGSHVAVELNSSEHTALFIAEGLGHAFCALTPATVVYACSTRYNPSAEHEINPLDPELGLPWPADLDLVVSEKDRRAPSLAAALSSGLLPRYDWRDAGAS